MRLKIGVILELPKETHTTERYHFYSLFINFKSQHLTSSIKNIRIHIDNRYLQSDPKTCYDEGDSVEIGEPTSSVACKESGTSPILKDCYYTCTEDDVLSELVFHC
jgi:hypothetical protein